MDVVTGMCMGTGRVNGLLQPEEDQMQTMRNVLERWGGPQQILLERMKGQRKWSRGDSLALQTGLYCGQVATEPPDPPPTDLASLF